MNLWFGFLYVFDVPRFRKASRSWSRNRHSFVAISGQNGGLMLRNLMLFGLPVSLHLLGMLLEADGETGVAGGVTDKVQIVGLGRVQRRAQ